MSSHNMFESAVDEVLEWVERISDEVAPMVMGGKEPPFLRKLSGDKLAEWWQGMGSEEKIERWMGMAPEDKAEIQKAMQGSEVAGERESGTRGVGHGD